MDIQIDHLFYRYSKKHIAFEDFSLSLHAKNEVIAITGHNGAGKTTLIHLITGNVKPQKGHIITSFNEVAYLPFQNQLFSHLNVIDNLKFWYQIYLNRPFNIDEDLVQAILKPLQLNNLLDIKAKHLSSGEAKKVGLACVLFQNKGIVFLDEPFNGIDPISVQEMIHMIHMKKDEGVTFIISAHQLELLEQIYDQFIIIRQGQLVYQSTKRLNDSLLSIYTKYHE